MKAKSVKVYTLHKFKGKLAVENPCTFFKIFFKSNTEKKWLKFVSKCVLKDMSLIASRFTYGQDAKMRSCRRIRF